MKNILRKRIALAFPFLALLLMPAVGYSQSAGSIPSIGPVRVEFILFVLTLIGVAAVAAADREMGTARSVSIVEWLVGLLPRRRRRESP